LEIKLISQFGVIDYRDARKLVADYLIGTGGWAYFKVPNKPSLKAWSFDFIEVNQTFYE